MKRKCLAILLVLCMCLTIWPVSAFADDVTTGANAPDGFYTSEACTPADMLKDGLLQLERTVTTLYFPVGTAENAFSQYEFELEDEDEVLKLDVEDLKNGIAKLTLTVQEFDEHAECELTARVQNMGIASLEIEFSEDYLPDYGFYSSENCLANEILTGTYILPTEETVIYFRDLNYEEGSSYSFVSEDTKLHITVATPAQKVIPIMIQAQDGFVKSQIKAMKGDVCVATITVGAPTQVDPREKFYWNSACSDEYAIDELELSQKETTIYFYAASADAAYTFECKDEEDLLYIEEGKQDNHVIPIVLTVVDDSHDETTIYAYKNGEQAASLDLIITRECTEPLPDYGFYEFSTGQYRLISGIYSSRTQQNTLYFRKGNGDFTSETDVHFTWNTGTDQNDQLILKQSLQNGMIALNLTCTSTQSFNGIITATVDGSDVGKFEFKYNPLLEKNGRVAFTVAQDSTEYQLGFAEKIVNGIPSILTRAEYLTQISNEDRSYTEAFYLAMTSGFGEEKRAEEQLYSQLVESATFTITQTGDNDRAPAIENTEHSAGWKGVALTYGQDNIGVWRIDATIKLTQQVDVLDQKTDDIIATDTVQLCAFFELRNKDDIVINVSSIEEVQSYLDLLSTDAGLEELQKQYPALIQNDARLILQLSDGKYKGHLTSSVLLRDVVIRGDQNKDTELQGTFRIVPENKSDGGDGPSFEGISFKGAGKNTEFWPGEQNIHNYALSGPGSITYTDCTFEKYKVAVYDGSIDDDADTDDDANLKFGSSGCAFYNNGIAIYLNGKTISGDGNAQITNAIFEKNDCAVYIEELDRSLPSYEYGITYSKFIDNTCDLYYADMYELFLPGNYFGDKHGNARMPQLDGEIITRRYYDKITGQIYTETLDTSTLLNVYPIYDSEDMIDLCILENIDHVMLMDDQANEFLISQDSLLTRTEELTIDVVTKDKALEDSDNVETLDILPVGSWNFSQK